MVVAVVVVVMLFFTENYDFRFLDHNEISKIHPEWQCDRKVTDNLQNDPVIQRKRRLSATFALQSAASEFNNMRHITYPYHQWKLHTHYQLRSVLTNCHYLVVFTDHCGCSIHKNFYTNSRCSVLSRQICDTFSAILEGLKPVKEKWLWYTIIFESSF